MKKNIFSFFRLICIVFVLFIAQDVLACECDGIPTPYGAYRESAYVFTGKVTEIKDQTGKEIIEDETVDRTQREGERFYTFEIQELFKGAKAPKVVVSYDINMCQFGFNKGDTFLVYAFAAKDGTLATYSFCWRTGSIDDTQDDVYFLRGLLAKKPEPRIYGSLHLYDKARTDSLYDYLQGIKIVAKNGKKKFATLTDKNGLYSFRSYLKNSIYLLSERSLTVKGLINNLETRSKTARLTMSGIFEMASSNLPDGRYKVYPEISNEYVTNWHYTYEEIILGKTNEFPGRFFSRFIGKNAYTEFQIKRK